MHNKIIKVWTFPSVPNCDVQYETLQFVDGTASCNCKGGPVV